MAPTSAGTDTIVALSGPPQGQSADGSHLACVESLPPTANSEATLARRYQLTPPNPQIAHSGSLLGS